MKIIENNVLTTSVVVSKNDIHKIGHTVLSKNGNCCFICGETVSFEEILLRSILKLFGREYVIVSSKDFEWTNGDIDTIIYTNLPYEIYQQNNLKQE